jgi:uncharacterized membrane protein YcaP (DUF421 family)
MPALEPAVHQLLTSALGDPTTLVGTAIRVALVYGVLLFAIQVTGRRVLSQLTPFDLLTLLLLSNAVQNAMIGPDNSLVGGLLGAGVLLVSNRIIVRVNPLRRRFEPEPALLVHHGEIYGDRLAREGISEAELRTAIREHGIAGVAGVETAVLEMDGTISVIPAGPKRVRLHHVRSRRVTGPAPVSAPLPPRNDEPGGPVTPDRRDS